ncbi:MAG: class II fructose-bisphosphate aldolase [Alicyclobacillus sp.]|nr:class II fructose-bisphosphate aldolase [Alicyclobacillus sp.]
MGSQTRPRNVLTLKAALQVAERSGFAVGSFSPRYTPMIRAVLQAAEQCQSPAIVQISQKELTRYGIVPEEFAETFYNTLHEERVTVPVGLHLDHTKDVSVIRAAIQAGFTSVMIDASEHPLEENIRISREVVQLAHSFGVSVEAELGRIGTTDFIESDDDEEMYTDPDEAERFVYETGVDALAVSVGTAHGVYLVRRPKLDYDRLRAIKARVEAHLVLHGGSGVPPEMMERAIRLQGGGVSKVNIATDLELALLRALGRTERMTNDECKALPEPLLAAGRDAVRETVVDKMERFLHSAWRARDFVFA